MSVYFYAYICGRYLERTRRTTVDAILMDWHAFVVVYFSINIPHITKLKKAKCPKVAL